jgi:hypothetical protein
LRKVDYQITDSAADLVDCYNNRMIDHYSATPATRYAKDKIWRHGRNQTGLLATTCTTFFFSNPTFDGNATKLNFSRVVSFFSKVSDLHDG